MATPMTLAPAYEPTTYKFGVGPRSLAGTMAYSVKTEEFERQQFVDKLNILIADAIEEAHDAGDDLPSDGAWSVVRKWVNVGLDSKGPRAIRLPLVGVLPDGRIEVSFTVADKIPTGWTVVISKDGAYAKFIGIPQGAGGEPVVFETPLVLGTVI